MVEVIAHTAETANEARAAAKADEAQRNGTVPEVKVEVAPVKPENVPDKFWNGKEVDWTALAKSYTELEKKGSAKPEPKPDEQPKPKEGDKPDEKKPENKPESTPSVFGQEEYNRFSEEITKSGGKLSEDSYKELADKWNLSREVVDNHVKGVMAQGELNTSKIHSLAGGAEGYTQMIEWAQSTLSDAEKATFDKAVTHGSEADVSVAVRGLHARFTQAEGFSPRRVLGGGAGSSVTPFASTAQLSKAINDPRYASDPAYREEVAARLRASSM